MDQNTATAAVADRETERKSLLAKLGYIPFSDVCIILNVEESTGRNRKSAGNFPPVYRLGRDGHVCKLAEVDAWMRRRRGTR